jgi:hypothetical protein
MGLLLVGVGTWNFQENKIFAKGIWGTLQVCALYIICIFVYSEALYRYIHGYPILCCIQCTNTKCKMPIHIYVCILAIGIGIQYTHRVE